MASPYISIDYMDNNFELLKNVLAIILSTGTMLVMISRYMNKERIEHAKQIANIIDKSTNKIFNISSLEHRVQLLETAEQENQEYMRESFAQVHARLDQIYSIIAAKK